MCVTKSVTCLIPAGELLVLSMSLSTKQLTSVCSLIQMFCSLSEKLNFNKNIKYNTYIDNISVKSHYTLQKHYKLMSGKIRPWMYYLRESKVCKFEVFFVKKIMSQGFQVVIYSLTALSDSSVLPSLELFCSFSNSVMEMEPSKIFSKLAVCGFSNFLPFSSWIYKNHNGSN